MGQVKGVAQLTQQFRMMGVKMARETGKTVRVNFTAPYAMRIHEDLQMPHPRGGQAKFLEKPIRELTNDGTLKQILRAEMHNGKTLAQALEAVGRRILAEAKKLVPVKTGKLRDSGIIEVVNT